MPTYLVTGASRGLGYEFVRQLASDPVNKVIGIVRDKASTERKFEEDDIRNVALYEADIVDLPALRAAAKNIETKFDGIDYLIANAAYLSEVSGWKTLVDFDDDPKTLDDEMMKSFQVNVIGTVHTFNAFLPLIRRGSTRKVIVISTGMADIDTVTRGLGIGTAAPYAISKAAVNMVVAKYHAMYAKEGILFLAICPGTVNTRVPDFGKMSPLEIANMQALGAKFVSYAPSFTGPSEPKDAVRDVMKVADEASLEKGYGGDFVSHLGKGEKWL